MSDIINIQMQKERNRNRKETERKSEVPHHLWGLKSETIVLERDFSREEKCKRKG